MGAARGTGTARGTATTAAAPGPQPAGSGAQPASDSGDLLGIGAAAQRAGVSERALRYYQQIGLLTPCSSTPGGLRRYSEDDLARVARIRQLQTLLGFNLEEVAVVLRNEDRMAQIRQAYHDRRTSGTARRELARESLQLQEDLRAAVEAKRLAIDGFLDDLDARIGRTRDLLAQMVSGSHG